MPSTFRRLRVALSRRRSLVSLARLVRNQAADVVRLSLFDGYEAERNGEYRLVEALAPRCRRAFDVGANRGDWSARLLAAGGPGLRLWAFEPATAARAHLAERFAAEPRVTIVPNAVSDFVGARSFMEKIGENHPQSSLTAARDPDPARHFEVEVITLDAHCASLDIDSIDFVKIDAEGHDLHVLRGARGLLDSGRIRYLQFEYETHWLRAGATLRAALDLLDGAGYQVRAVRADGLHRFDYDFHGDFFGYANFFAFRPEEEAALGELAAS